ncbi:NAD-dependent epimerase/dehydratase family protein [Allopontixanthobacter sp.]|uniref:NAD-dependent epimerase/dehydratase family protein n=1 Tax=Allopontixanthobacter sp. TaxID=2906452 RepID=UPI002AB8249C|nr:NAD-dependent epimerase/dehydratase family protein [Allopontixanthobacter sp.]MDZ4308103.1 GDP-mannose 4,6-dehydratase [Allopontixanthobacter sp.]
MHIREGLTLVAGGAGFIGSHLCRALLENGHRVVCIDNLQSSRESNLMLLQDYGHFDFVEADITQPLPNQVMRRAGEFTRIYNLACAASPILYQINPEHTLLTSVLGTNRLLRLAEQSGARFLLASTSEVYGDSEVHPQQEDYRGHVNCTGPRACYDEGKRAAETLAFDYDRAGRSEIRVARIFNTYGPNMRIDDGRVISNLVCQALSGEPLTVYGDGSQTRSFCYVADTVDGLRKLMECPMPDLQPINIGNPEEITIKQLASALAAIIGHPLDLDYCDLPTDDPRRRRPDIARARELLGWQPTTPLREGLEMTLAWFARELKANYPDELVERRGHEPVLRSAMGEENFV